MQKAIFNEGWTYGEKGQEKSSVRLPHDAMLHGKRRADSPGGSACAFFDGGIYEYEKIWTAPEHTEDTRYILQFDGVYQKSKVYVNDKEVGGCVYGYVPFFVDMTEAVRPGQDNLIRVVADNSEQPNSRWYSGGGIYRDVWLLTGKDRFIAPQGVQITTKSIDPAKVAVTVALEGKLQEKDAVQVSLLDGDKILAQDWGTDIVLDLADVTLWSEKSPKLYQCQVILYDEKETVVDQVTEAFGIRQISVSNQGLFINGQETLLRGGCVHHDNGILGAASFAEAEWRRVAMLKEAGFNAIRSSHNPASPHMLEAADALGMYVMDETWDMWFKHKNPKDYAGAFMDHFKADAKAMVMQDYNHPSVILYSIGNEVSEPASEQGMKVAGEIIAEIKKYDTTRPCTGGMNLEIISQSAKGKGVYDNEEGRDTSKEKKVSNMNSTMFNMITSIVGTGMVNTANSKKVDAITSPICDALDVAGYNYATGRYPLEAKRHPDRVIMGSETFPQMIAKNWAYVEKLPYLIGDFMWTAWDYLGEAGIGAWGYTEDAKGFEKPYPWLLADVGALDLLGNPNGEMFMAQAAWHLLDAPVIGVQPPNHPGITPAKGTWRGTNALPTWSWSGCEGNKTMVEVYSKEPSVTLYLNDKKIGTKKTKENVAKFKVAYEPGTLRAVSASGRESRLTSAKSSLQIQLKQETTRKDKNLVFIEVAIADADGVIEANHDIRLKASVEGGHLLGFGSANPRTEDDFTTDTCTTYYGRALLAIERDASVPVKVSVQGDALTGTLVLD